jgi:uncharacterized protein involved in outer membrane biogenesis
MKKKLMLGAGIAVLVVVVAAVALYLSLNSVVKGAVEGVLPRITGTPVSLEKASISLFSGKGELNGLVIGNPEGFKTDSAFSLGTVRIDLDPSSLLSDRIIIEEIYIDAPVVTYELSTSGDNISRIRKNIEQFAGTGDGAPDEQPGEEEPAPRKGKGKKVQINKFTFARAKVAGSATILQGQKIETPELSTIELTDIGKEKEGKSVGEVAKELFNPLSSSIHTFVADVPAIRNAARETLEQAGKSIKDAGKPLEDAGESLEKAGKEAADKVKDIFK